MNIVDILSILPFFIELFMYEEAPAEDEGARMSPRWFPNSTTTSRLEDRQKEDEDDDSFKGLVQVFRVFKLARILKLARHSRGLQSIVYTLSQSVPELGLLMMILIISGLIFASLTYYIEMVSQTASGIFRIFSGRKTTLGSLTSPPPSTG